MHSTRITRTAAWLWDGHRRRPSLATAVLGAVMLGVAAAPPAHATFAGTNGKLAFITDTSDGGFYVKDLTGIDGAVVPTPGIVFPRNTAWSRSGLKVAFSGPAINGGTGNALFIENADGTGLTQVGRGDRLRYNPVWSPDGTKLAFVQDNGSAGSGDIYTITTSGGSLTRLTTSSGWDGEPDWSPDGTRIAYTCAAGGRRQVCQMTPSGGSKTVTTASLGLGAASNPSWSPNSADIAFNVKTATGDLAIYRMSRTGGSLRELMSSSIYANGSIGSHGPAWSPDGTKIALEECVGGECGLTIRSAVDGTPANNPSTIAGGEGVHIDPSGWQRLP